MIDQLKKYQFLFEELVKRDFKKKYKRTVLGMGWSILSPLLVLASGFDDDLTVGDLLSDRYATKARNPEIAELFSHGS